MISPQGYSYGEEPKSANPFWDYQISENQYNELKDAIDDAKNAAISAQKTATDAQDTANTSIAEISDTITESNSYDKHELKETQNDGTKNDIGNLVIAKKQITNIELTEPSAGVSEYNVISFNFLNQNEEFSRKEINLIGGNTPLYIREPFSRAITNSIGTVVTLPETGTIFLYSAAISISFESSLGGGYYSHNTPVIFQISYTSNAVSENEIFVTVYRSSNLTGGLDFVIVPVKCKLTVNSNRTKATFSAEFNKYICFSSFTLSDYEIEHASVEFTNGYNLISSWGTRK